MRTYQTAQQILDEIDRVLSDVDEAEIDALCGAILEADQIFAYGLGREGLVMRGFAMRLMHLGLDVAVVGDMTAPPIGAGDLFLVSCGPGYLSTVEALVEVARDAGGRVAMVTAQPDAPLPQRANLRIDLPAQTMAEDEQSSSLQAMGSVFEQAMWIFFDALVPRLQDELDQTADDLRRRHTNLE
ncbi:MAG: 3-hexulose-6-phosphate isomerase [Anaerolineales bacterium]|nr:3-hexulose-6-phosphate isomerase [Anaerolineales bacterium]